MERIWFHDRRPQWWRVLRVSLLWGGLLMVAVLALDEPEPARPAAPPVAVVPSAPASAFLSRRGFVGLANAPIAAQRARAQASAPAGVSASAEVEVCGVGRVRTSASDRTGRAALEAMRSPAAAAAWLDTVIASGDERARAAALFVRGHLAQADATRGLADPDPVCMDNPACRKPFEDLSAATAERSGARWRDALAQLGTRTTDPAVYAQALQACRTPQGGSRPGPCQQITLEQWARLDDRNGVPWLHLAEAARARNDTAAMADALHRAAQADQLRHHGFSLVPWLLASPPRELSPAQGALLTHDVINLQLAWAAPSYLAPIRLCSEGTPGAGVRDTCRQLAELMVRKPGTLMDLNIGITLGERSGWAPDRVKALRDGHNATRSAGSALVNADMALACPAVDRLRRHFVEVGRIGEAAAIRQAMGASAPR